MISSSIASSKTREERTGCQQPSPQHLMSRPDEMFASSNSEPSKDRMPNDPPPPTHLMSLSDKDRMLMSLPDADRMPNDPPPTHLMSLPYEYRMSKDPSPPTHLMSLPDEDRMSKDPSPPTHLMSLPDEVLVLIFSFLPLRDICNNAVLVCSKWRHIGRDYAVYRTITISGDMIPTKKWDIERSSVFSIIQRAVKLTSFNCWTRNRRNANLLLEAVAKYCPHLQHLSVNAGVSKESMQLLSVKCPILSTIIIGGGSLRNYSDLSNFKFLRVLKIHFNFFKSIEVMSEERSELFRNILKECHSLEELYVQCFVIDDVTFQCIINQTKDRLKALSLTTSNYQSESFKQLSSCVLLERLSLLNYSANSDSTIDLSPLKNLRNMKCLKLKGYLSIKCKEYIRELFAECTFRELRVLTILDCSSGDDELLQLLAASFPQLTVLSLRGFQTASDAGIAELLKKCPMLRSIKLEGFGTWTKGTCFNINHPRLEMVEIVHCDGFETNVVDALRHNSKLRVCFTESTSLAPLTDIFEDMKCR